MTKHEFEPSYDVDQYNEDDPKEIEYHFFGASMYEWKTGADFQEVYNWFAEQGHTFNLHFVPRHAQAPYDIYHGCPQEVDAHWLGIYRFPEYNPDDRHQAKVDAENDA